MDRFIATEEGIQISIEGIPEDAGNVIAQLSRSHAALLADNPIYRLKWDRTFWSEKANENGTTLYKVHMWKCSLYTENRYEKALHRADAIVNALGKSDDLYTKIIKLGNYEQANFIYDENLYQENSDWPYYGQTYKDSAYGALINNYAVCAGFADTFKILCDKAGIPCIVVGNGSHAWNYVQMEDGKWYSVDNRQTSLEGKAELIYDVNDMYIASAGDFKFPDLSDDNYQYQGENTDFSINVIENEDKVEEASFLYSINGDNKSCTITGYEGTFAGDIVIPKMIDGYIVTAIGTEAFYRASAKGKIVLPANVIEIGSYAFKGCNGITEVEFPQGLETIGDGAFVGCENLSGALVFPESLKSIGNEAFYNCKNNRGILHIPNKTILGNDAFYNCGISEYIIDSDNENYSIYEGALYSKDGKTLLSCPEGKSGELRIKEGTEKVADKACKNCSKLSGVVFPDTLKVIGDYAFQDTCFTGNLTLPNCVETIGYCAFARTGAYKFDSELVLPVLLKDLRAYAFLNCGFTGTLVIPPGIERIGCDLDWGEGDPSRFVFGGNDFASYGIYCNNKVVKDYLSEVKANFYDLDIHVLHPICGTTDFSEGDNCLTCGEKVDAITHDDTEHSLCEIAPTEPTCSGQGNNRYWICRKCGTTYSDKDGNTKISKEQIIRKAAGHNWIEEKKEINTEYAGVTNIIYQCKDCGIETTKFSVSDNNKEYSVYDGALYTKDGKTLLLCPDDRKGELVIKEGTKAIADSACNNCRFLTSVTFPDSLETIGGNAFAWTGIEELTIPPNVKTIGFRSFGEMSSLKHLSFSDSGILEIIGPNAFVNCDFTGDLVLPDSVKEIGTSAFQRSGHYPAKGTLHLPENLEKLGSFAFSDCGFTGLLRVPKGIKEINLDSSGKIDYPAIFRGNDFSKVEVFCNSTKVQDYIREEFSEYNVDLERLKVIHKSPICSEEGYADGITCSLCGETIRTKDNIAPSGHVLTAHSATEATCTKSGNKEYWSCSECGKFFSDKEGKNAISKDSWIIANGHSWNEGVVTTEPTCTEKGAKVFTCTRCGETKTEDIEERKHSFAEEFTIDMEPTCVKEGIKSKHCVYCDEKAEITTIEPHGHTYGEWEEVMAGTCSGESIKKRSCSICGFTETEPSEPEGHAWEDEYTIDVSATCKTDGSKSIHCKDCEISKCSEVIPAVGHSFGEWNSLKKATCTESGIREKACSVCGDKVTEVIPALGHAWQEKPTIDKASTCKEAGSQSIHCDRCNETKDKAPIPAKGHTIELRNAAAASCSEAGYSGDKYCSDCGEFLGKGSELKAIGHKKISVKTVAATCQSSGMKAHFECEHCGVVLDKKGKVLSAKAKKKLNIKKKKHNYKKKSGEYLKSAATCTSPVIYYYTCSMCGEKGKKTYKSGKARGHDFVSGNIKKATGKKDGKIASKCSRCGKTNKGVKISKASKIVVLNKKSVAYVGAGGEKDLIKVVVKNSKYPLNENEYDVSYSEPVYKGKKSKGTVTIKFKPECKYYSGSLTLTYKITKVPKK